MGPSLAHSRIRQCLSYILPALRLADLIIIRLSSSSQIIAVNVILFSSFVLYKIWPDCMITICPLRTFDRNLLSPACGILLLLSLLLLTHAMILFLKRTLIFSLHLRDGFMAMYSSRPLSKFIHLFTSAFSNAALGPFFLLLTCYLIFSHLMHQHRFVANLLVADHEEANLVLHEQNCEFLDRNLECMRFKPVPRQIHFVFKYNAPGFCPHSQFFDLRWKLFSFGDFRRYVAANRSSLVIFAGTMTGAESFPLRSYFLLLSSKRIRLPFLESGLNRTLLNAQSLRFREASPGSYLEHLEESICDSLNIDISSFAAFSFTSQPCTTIPFRCDPG